MEDRFPYKKKRVFETRDFEILPKFSETHVFRGAIRHPSNKSTTFSCHLYGAENHGVLYCITHKSSLVIFWLELEAKTKWRENVVKTLPNFQLLAGL